MGGDLPAGIDDLVGAPTIAFPLTIIDLSRRFRAGGRSVSSLSP